VFSAGATWPAALADLSPLITAQTLGDSSVSVTGVSLDSQTVDPGDLFAALPGRNSHGAEYVAQALRNGAVAVITDSAGFEICRHVTEPLAVPIMIVDQPRNKLGDLCARIYGQPPMTLIGITGTNGKTTTSYMVVEGAKAAGFKTGMIGTLATFIGDIQLPSIRTTPEAPEIFRLLAQMHRDGVEVVVMEVSSIAIAEHRIDGLHFDVVGFTNLSHDHLDYHGSMENYAEAKGQLFTSKYARKGVVTINDQWGKSIFAQNHIPLQSLYFAGPDENCVTSSDWFATQDLLGNVQLRDPHGKNWEFKVLSPGTTNAINSILAIALLQNIGCDIAAVMHGVGDSLVPGRGELVTSLNDVQVFVDYAHSPDAIESFLLGLRDRTGGKIITILGAGGNRDKLKRPDMGINAAKYSDLVIITDDNPRDEEPQGIRAEIVRGVREVRGSRWEEIADRRAAISRALEIAVSGDAIAILGKGHESSIEFNSQLIPFNDAEVVMELVSRV
jgi:UDP-N-acetylmuramoyl-L-alanyl-D-glutamate--2,6-diaminopimelate ligase